MLNYQNLKQMMKQKKAFLIVKKTKNNKDLYRLYVYQ